MCKTVRELVVAINHCCYRRDEDNDGGEVYVCNLCGNTFLSFQDAVEHIMIEHINDIIPDVDPTEI